VVDHDQLGFDPGSVFDSVASGYEAHRPGYPNSLYDAVERAVGPLSGRRVVDVGAGTGISGRALAARGAKVIALDPSMAMASTLRQASGSLPVTLGRAEAIPIASRSADLVTCAQAWHWVRIPDAAVECRRVLGPGGRLVLWWNVSEAVGAFFDVLASECGIEPYGVGDHQDDRARLIDAGGFSDLVVDAVRWAWTVPVEHWLLAVQTRSVLAKLGAGAAERLDAIEDVARQFFPSGLVTEWFTTRLVIAVP
jgi:SAM-dependent methyltransferase